MSTQPDVEWRPHSREYRIARIARIDRARGTITLTLHALLSDNGPDNADAACALDLANDDLQRLRDEIDATRLEEFPEVS